jgi:hypothetical protein
MAMVMKFSCTVFIVLGLHNFFSLPNIIRVIKSRINEYNILVGKPEEKRPLGRPKHR